MFRRALRPGVSLPLGLIFLLWLTLLSTGCGGNSTMSASNPGATVPTPTPTPTPTPAPGLGVGSAPAQATFLYGTYGATVLGARVTPNGQVIDVPMPTDANSGDTGFMTGTGGNVDSIAIDPKGRFVYTLDVQTSSFGIPIGNNGIGAFTIDRATGELARVAGSPYPINYRGGSVVESGNGAYLYAAGSGAGTIEVFAINQATGAVTVNSTVTGVPGDGLAASWDGRFIFDGDNSTVTAYAITPATGALTAVSSAYVENIGPIYLSYSGKFLYSVSDTGITVMSVSSTGQLTVTQANFPAVQTAGGIPRRMLATSRDDRFAYVATSSGQNVGSIQAYALDANTGAIGAPVGTPVTMLVGQAPLQVTLDFNGKFLYATFTGTNLLTFPINPDGSIGHSAVNPGVTGTSDFFELSP